MVGSILGAAVVGALGYLGTWVFNGLCAPCYGFGPINPSYVALILFFLHLHLYRKRG